MSSVVKKDGKYQLDEIEEAKLNLLWLSSKDFHLLRKPENKILLNRVWADKKNEMQTYFQENSRSLDSITNSFRKVNFTINPVYPSGYEAEENILLLNLWDLLYSVTDRDFAIPTPPWKLGGELVHEHDHYNFLLEHNMIGKTEKEYERFNKKYLRKLEKRAFLIQQAFLGNCKKNVPIRTFTYTIIIRRWLPKKMGVINTLPRARAETISSIDNGISQISEVINDIEAGKDYEIISGEHNFETSLKLVDILSLPIKLNRKQKAYPRIEITM